jgi:hypothetical protein
MSNRNGISAVGALSSEPIARRTEMGACAGVDWASDQHDVLVADAAGDALLAATYERTEAGSRRSVRR